MSLPFSHPLHQQSFRQAQVNLCRRKICLDQRQAAYDRRDHDDSEYHKKIKSAHAAADNNLALVLEKHHAEAYGKIKAVIDRFNLNTPIDVWETSSADISASHALLFKHLVQVSPLKITDETKIHLVMLVVDAPLLPPGEAIRSTPRRPGAPSAALPR